MNFSAAALPLLLAALARAALLLPALPSVLPALAAAAAGRRLEAPDLVLLAAVTVRALLSPLLPTALLVVVDLRAALIAPLLAFFEAASVCALGAIAAANCELFEAQQTKADLLDESTTADSVQEEAHLVDEHVVQDRDEEDEEEGDIIVFLSSAPRWA